MKRDSWMGKTFDGCLRQGFSSDFTMGPTIGEGAFGKVLLAQRQADGRYVAVKVFRSNIKPEKATLGSSLDAARQDCGTNVSASTQAELAAWARVGRHKHCVELLAAYHEDTFKMGVMELCRASIGDLLQLVSPGCLVHIQLGGEQVMAYLARQMLMGLAYVHKCGIVHRDLQPSSFLLGGAEGQTVKLSDFNSAETLPPHGVLRGVFGSAPYVSPEMAGKCGYGFSTDVWSLGATAYHMLYGEVPYRIRADSPDPEHDSLLAVICGAPQPRYTLPAPSPSKVFWHQKRPAGPVMSDELTSKSPRQPASQVAEDFLKALLDRKPKHRCTATQALEHPFVTVSRPRFSLGSCVERLFSFNSRRDGPGTYGI